MKKLKFILKNNDNIICNESVVYKERDDAVHFEALDSQFIFKVKNHGFTFKKNNDSQEFIIIYDGRKAKSFLLMNAESIKLPLNVLVLEFFSNANLTVIKYKISSDPKIIKTIEFRY